MKKYRYSNKVKSEQMQLWATYIKDQDQNPIIQGKIQLKDKI